MLSLKQLDLRENRISEAKQLSFLSCWFVRLPNHSESNFVRPTATDSGSPQLQSSLTPSPQTLYATFSPNTTPKPCIHATFSPNTTPKPVFDGGAATRAGRAAPERALVLENPGLRAAGFARRRRDDSLTLRAVHAVGMEDRHACPPAPRASVARVLHGGVRVGAHPLSN